MPLRDRRFVARLIGSGIAPAQALAALAVRYPALVDRAQRMARDLVAELSAPE